MLNLKDGRIDFFSVTPQGHRELMRFFSLRSGWQRAKTVFLGGSRLRVTAGRVDIFRKLSRTYFLSIIIVSEYSSSQQIFNIRLLAIQLILIFCASLFQAKLFDSSNLKHWKLFFDCVTYWIKNVTQSSQIDKWEYIAY